MQGLGFALAVFATLALAGEARAARGSDGELKILFWQAVSTLNPYLSGGVKEEFASSIVLEPLANFDEKGATGPATRRGRCRRRRTAASPPISPR